MAMSVQSHKTSHSLPTTDLRATLHDSQRPRRPRFPPTHDPSTDDYPIRSISSLSCYPVPKKFQRHGLKDKATCQLRSVSACSGRIIRPPLQLHQRRFLSEGQIPQVGPAFILTSEFDLCSHGSVESSPASSAASSPTSQEDHFMTPLSQRQNAGMAFASDTEIDKRYTFGPLKPPPTFSSRWSESSMSEAGTAHQSEGEFTDSESSNFENSDIEDLSHFSVIRARRVSIHTWVLKPMTADIIPDPEPQFFGWNTESADGPTCPKEVKRWGVIF